MIRDLARASAIFAAGSFASKFAKLLLIPLMVRYLTPDEIGMVVFLEAIMLACSRFFSLGLGQAVRRFYGELPDAAAADAYVRVLWLASLAFAAGGLALFGALATAVPQAFSANVPADLMLLTLLAGALRSAHTIPMQRFVARREAGRHGLLEFLELTTTVGLILALLAGAGWGLRGYLWGSVIAAGAWTAYYGLTLSAGPRGGTQWAALGPALRYSLPLWPHMLFTWAITFVDRLVLERLVPLADVGVYGIGYQLASVIPVVTLAVTNAWLPLYFRGGGTAAGRHDFLWVLNRFCGFIAALVLGLYLAAPEIVRLVATAGYGAAAGILQVVAIGMGFHATYQAMILVLFYEKKGLQVSLATGAALAVNVLGLAWLVPAFGIVGAAWATVLAFAAATAWSAVRARVRLGMSVAAVTVAIAPVLVTTAALSLLRTAAAGPLPGGRLGTAAALAALIVTACVWSARSLPERPSAAA